MTIKTTKNGQIVVRGQGNTAADRMVELVRKLEPEIAKALPRHLEPGRLARIVMTTLRTNPKLAETTSASFLGSVMSAAQLGLEVNTPLGHAYLVPFKTECTLIVGYQGMIDIARRSGIVTGMYAHVVREGDMFKYRLGLEPTLDHEPSDLADRESRPITHVYAVAKIKGGDPMFVVLSRAQVEARRARSRAAQAGPWVTDYEAMCLKTAIRVLWKWVPKSAEMARAAALEEAHETGKQATAWEPSVQDALEKEGLEAEYVDAEPPQLAPRAPISQPYAIEGGAQ